jgi:hypothetical protein
LRIPPFHQLGFPRASSRASVMFFDLSLLDNIATLSLGAVK